MGAEAECTCRVQGKESTGRAHLETDELVFRGSFRLAIPYKSISAASASDGRLTISFDRGAATFELGPQAEKWANKISNPKTLIDKLGIKNGSAVATLGFKDPGFIRQLSERAGDLSEGRLKENRDAIFFAAEKKSDLGKLERIKACLKPNGALWVVRPKGVDRITEADVLGAGKAAGLVDVKVVRFSETHTAEKFVIPKARR